MSGVSFSLDDNYHRLLSTPQARNTEMQDDEDRLNFPGASHPSTSHGDWAVPAVPRGPHPNTNPDQIQRIAYDGIGIAGIISEQVISHPFTILKRQCQVNRKALRYHLTPVTLFPVVVKLVRRQGLGTLWKGAGSVFIIRGLTLATETAFSDLLGFPKEIYWYSSIKQLLQHAALKTVSFVIVTPFYAASLVETVQSDITSEKPGVLDCLKEGVYRVVQWGKPRSSSLLPVWFLVGPTLLHSVLHYFVSSVVRSTTMWYMKATRPQQQESPLPQQKRTVQNERYYIEMASSLVGSLSADVLLYPVETVLHRLYVQGTRSIIDNLDTGLAVTNVVTKYEGFFDCFQTIVDEEGASGLYKGIGATAMQCLLQFALLKGTKMLLDRIMIALRK